MATWHLAPSLVKLRDEVDAAYPKRSKTYDGTIGDAAHASRASEHNPDNDSDPMPKGAVSAIDITATDNNLKDAVMKAANKDPRVWYYISEGYIYSRTYDWAKREYTGADPHENHVHISLRQTKEAHDDTSSWGIAKAPAPKPPAPKPPTGDKKLPTLAKGDKHAVLVPFLKRFFWAKPPNQDSVFGSGTRAKVVAYQAKNKLKADGIVGPATWAKIASGGTKLPDGFKL